MLLMSAAGQAQFEIDHYMAGLGATMTAAASLLGALAALGITKKKSAAQATEKASAVSDQSVIEAYERGVEKGVELAKQNP